MLLPQNRGRSQGAGQEQWSWCNKLHPLLWLKLRTSLTEFQTQSCPKTEYNRIDG